MIKKILPLFFLAIVLVSCQPDVIYEDYTAAEKAKVEKLLFAKITDKKPILADGESLDVVYSRSFNVRNPLSAAADGSDSFKLVNYSPTTIKYVTIYAKLKGYPERIKLYTLDSIASFTEFKHKAPFVNTVKPTYYSTETGKWVEISGLVSVSDVVFSLDSSDPVFTKLKNLKTNWTINFSIKGNAIDEGQEGAGGWWELRPVQAREYVVFFCNLAYMFSQDEWKDRFFAYEGLVDNNKLPITQEVKEKIYNDIINWKTFNTGLVKAVSGLGGGNTLGVAEYVLLYQYTQDVGDTAFHELGHCLGYGHDSNMTYPSSDGKAFFQICAPYLQELLKTKQAPYWNYKTLNTLAKYKNKTGFLEDTDPSTVINYENY